MEMSISVVAEAVPGVAATAAPTLSMLSRPIREAVPIGLPFARVFLTVSVGMAGHRGGWANLPILVDGCRPRPGRRDLSEQRRDVEDEVGEDRVHGQIVAQGAGEVETAAKPGLSLAANEPEWV